MLVRAKIQTENYAEMVDALVKSINTVNTEVREFNQSRAGETTVW